MAGVGEAPGLDTIQSVLREYPVRLVVLFGSHAKGTPHPRSDIDIAVEMEGLRPGDDGYNEAFFGLSADVNEEVNPAVDVLDLHTLSPEVVRAIFDHGVLLFGDQNRAEELRRELVTERADPQSPRERFDEALDRIDGHLARASGDP